MGIKTRTISFKESTSYGLNAQSKLGQYDFPFTLNPTKGCFFGCKYCYSATMFPGPKEEKKNSFFNHIEISLDKADLLKEELPKYMNLPQHLKRVQINETSDYYLSQVLKEIDDKKKPDVMLEILNVFKQEWDKGNKWMLHILTKSPLILRHIDKLKEMKEMVQVEISFATEDETTSRELEFFTPTIKKRLDLVESLSKEGIFVRIMAMPFYGDAKSLDALKGEAFKRGAKAFKNKGLNYYKWEDLKNVTDYEVFIKSNIPDNEGRKDIKDETRIIKSGETVKINGDIQKKTVLMPKDDFADSKKWAAATKIETRIEGSPMEVIDCGYRDCNNVDWGYII